MNTPIPEETEFEKFIPFLRKVTNNNTIELTEALSFQAVQEYAQSYHSSKMKESEGMETEKLAELILDKHFPHSYYHPNGNYKEKEIHDNDCERCRYDGKILLAMIEMYAASRPSPMKAPTITDQIKALSSSQILNLHNEPVELVAPNVVSDERAYSVREKMSEKAAEDSGGGWVSVEEKRPGSHTVVLICNTTEDGFNYCGTGYIDENDKWFHGTKSLSFVTHWMPMPALPPKHPK